MDVWSEEGVGTEIKVTFNAEVDGEDLNERGDGTTCMEAIKVDNGALPTISLAGFQGTHRGTRLLERALRTYLGQWWHFDIVVGAENGDIVILNEDISPVIRATESYDIDRPFIILSSSRGNASVMQVATDHEGIGGFCRILYKPGGPARLRNILKLAVHSRSIASASADPPVPDADEGGRMPRRNSEESQFSRRPHIGPRSTSAYPSLPSIPSSNQSTEKGESPAPSVSPHPLSPRNCTANNTSPDVTEYTDKSTPSWHKSSPEITTSELQNGDHLQTFLSTGLERPASESGELGTVAFNTTIDTNVYDDIESSHSHKIKSPSIHYKLPAVNGNGPTTEPVSPDSVVIPIGDSGTLLKSSIQPSATDDVKRFRVLVVEDNGILRNLL